ncbi:MAG: type II toxin-antitoxin system PemK/MazF family toxin [Desertimonas sp.]
MRRGDIWTAAAGSGYAGKPRPVVIVQDDRFDATDSITICAMTTDPTDAPLFRVVITPDEQNQLREVSRVMVDKLTTVPRAKLGEHIGRLSDEDTLRLGRSIIVFLGLAGPPDPSTR